MALRGATPLLSVADIGRSIAFYRLLGLEVVARTISEPDNETVWVLLAGQGGPQLMLAAHGGVSHEERRMRPSLAGVVLFWECDDLDGVFDALCDARYSPEPISGEGDDRAGQKAGTASRANGRRFFVRDPDGYELALTEMPQPPQQSQP